MAGNKRKLKRLIELANLSFAPTIFDIMDINYSVIDPDGNYIIQNKMAEETISKGLVKAQEIDQKTWNDCILVMESGKKSVKEELFKGKYYLSVKKPLIENNICYGIMILSIDINKEKQAEIAKDDFISNMEHDLRTPFSGISGIAHLLYEEATDPYFKEMLGLIVKSSEQWMYIQNRIFDVLVVHEEPKVETFYLQEELNRIQEMMAATLSLKGIYFEIHCPPTNELGMLEADRIKIQLVLLSLVGNAVKFTEKGGITLSVSVEENKIFIKITDTGIGIPEDKIDNLFQKFTKVERSHKFGSDFRGVGLGLYVSKQYANNIGGDITVRSSLGVGSEFTFFFPANLKN